MVVYENSCLVKWTCRGCHQLFTRVAAIAVAVVDCCFNTNSPPSAISAILAVCGAIAKTVQVDLFDVMADDVKTNL